MLKSAVNLFFPPQCMICEMILPIHGALCAECWNKVPFISVPICGCCGLPMEFAVDEHSFCGECLREHPPYSRARAAFVYNDYSRALVLKLKFQDQPYLSPILGRWLNSAGAELIAASDLIIPVPLHYWRMVRRRYNQSLLLARIVAQNSGIPLLTDGLIRHRATRQQVGLSRPQRRENVRNAFIVPAHNLLAIKGKSILLIDDVLTTGATIAACAKTLLKAEAGQVNVLTLARRG